MAADKNLVLVIDDDELVRTVLVRQLRAIGCEAVAADSGPTAMELLRISRFDIVLLDLHLPGMDGLQILGTLLERDPELAVIMVTGQAEVDLAVRALRDGAYDYLAKPVSLEELRIALDRALELRALRAMKQDEEARLRARVEEQERRLTQSYLETVKALAAALEAKDPYTCGHSERVTAYSLALARRLGFEMAELQQLSLAGQLHDIGKIGIREEVLNKNGRLTDEEFAHVKEHPEIAEQMLGPITSLAPILPTVRHHHERYDGRGYPDGLAGEDIPLAARVTAVADAFDAMTSSRAYRKALSVEEARRRLEEGKGSQFDGRLVDAFCELLDEGAIAPPSAEEEDCTEEDLELASFASCAS